MPPDPAAVAQVRAAGPTWTRWVSLALSWAAALAAALLMWRIGVGVDTVAASDRPGTGALIGLAALALVAGGGTAVAAGFTPWAAGRTEQGLRQRIVQGAFAQPTAASAGARISAATGGAERAATYRAGFIGPTIGALTIPFLTLGVMAVLIDPVIAGWLALLVLVVPLLVGGFQRLAKPIGAAYRRTQGELTSAFLEAIQSLETLVYFRAAGRTEADLARRGEQHRRGLMRMLAGNQLLILVVDAAFSLTIMVTAAGLAVHRVQAGQLTLGGGVAIMLLTTLVVGPVDLIGQFFYVGMAGRAAERQISRLVVGSASSTPEPVPDEAVDASLDLDSVTAGWVRDRPVVHDLTFHVAPGEKVALVGPSGVGKSTVAALLQGQLRPWKGRVQVGGVVAGTPAARADLSVVEQRTYLFLGTIAENLRLARPAATDDQLWDVLAVAGLADDVRAMPKGLETPVGEHGTLLSGGQAQRLSIARAALRDAPILLLDEPTSQVDLAGEAAIVESLDRLSAGRTVLVISHRPGAVLAADRVITLRDGTLADATSLEATSSEGGES